MTKLLYIIVLIIALFFIVFYFFSKSEENASITKSNDKDPEHDSLADEDRLFIRTGLKTNTSIHSIPIDEVLGGGPAKDGIPAILEPSFISLNEAKKIEKDDRQGVVVTVGNTTRFYPYSILVWHEIVNDIIEDTPVIVTFCPLCGSAIVFNPIVDGEKRTFGVSGKLWESNLLMYDKTNESLWSQILGKAVVGDDTGKSLEILPSQLITFKEFANKYPNGEVLSRNTGEKRNYDFYPYGSYESSDELYFPVSVSDTRLSSKEIMFIVNIDEYSGAFKRSDLLKVGSGELQVGNITVSAKVEGTEIKLTNKDTKEELAGYTAMWFSWAAHHQENGSVWSK